MFRIAICDDDKQDRQEIKECLDALYAEGYKFKVQIFAQGFELVEHYQKGKVFFNLIILDMLMRGLNGLEAARKIRQLDEQVPILVVSTSTEFALEGYDIGASSYLAKPLDKLKLLTQVRKIMQRQLDFAQCFVVHDAKGLHAVPLREIYYFESHDHELFLKTANKEYRLTLPLSRIAQNLKAKGFVRIHKSFVVNLEWITDFMSSSVKLLSGEELPLSKNKKKAIQKQWLEFLAGGTYGT